MAEKETALQKQRREILERTIAEIQKKQPDNIIGKYSEIGANVDVEVISTGSLAVDAAIGGGFAKGRLINLVGHTSSGKTTLALTAIAEEQKKNPDANILYIDAEFALDPRYAAALGVDLNKIVLSQPSSGEEGYEAAEMFIASGVADIVVIDSIAAMLPKAMLEKDYNAEAQPGVFARLTTSAIGRINRLASLNNTTVILINQWKPVVRINQYQAVPGALGGWYQPGGGQLAFFCSQIIEVKKSGEIKEGTEIKSNVITMTCKKNKIAPPHRIADFVITYGVGLDEIQELISLGVAMKEIKISGSFYTFPNLKNAPEKPVQGRVKVGELLKENEALRSELRKALKKQIEGAQEIIIEKETSSTPTEG